MISKVLFGASAGLGLAVIFLFRANASLNEEIGSIEASLEQAIIVNQRNMTTLRSLEETLDQCVNDRVVDEEQNAAVVVRLERDLAAAEEARQEVEIIREEIFREPSCAELGAIDIADVCPALGDSLLDSANRLN